jgi:Bacterial Ig-like domain
MMSARTVKLAVALSAAAVSLSAQQSPRRATNIAALRSFPAFYHLRPVVVVGTLALGDNGDLRLSNDGAVMRVVYKGNTPDTLAEVRGEFVDLGRMNADDPRLAGLDAPRTFHFDPEGPWPKPGAVMAIVASAVTDTVQPSTASIRGIVLHPARFLDQKVTVTGQFAGRNLLGDLPDAPAKSRYDFVVRSADASIWVTNLRPRGKDFELALDARIDTGRWVEVSGMLQQGRGLQWLDATGTTISLAKPPAADTTAQEAPIRVPAAPPPEVVFSAPTADESDVATATTVRVQFSRDISAPTLKGHVSVKYDAEDGVETPAIEFTTQYMPGNRVLEIRFSKPLEPLRKVSVELSDTILGMDQQPLIAWKLAFATGEK